MAPSNPLSSVIARLIESDGPIPFARYMDLCLYHEEHGYYTRGLGGGGGRDYVTGSGLHRAYGALMARQAEEMWSLLGEPERFRFVELGPGEGMFACDLLRAAAARPRFAEALEYVLVERSPALAARQRRRIESWAGPAGGASIAAAWMDLEDLERAESLPGCLFGNEVLDAFPVHRVVGTGDGPREIHVARRDGALAEVLMPLSTPALAEFLESSGIALEDGQEVDLNLEAQGFVERLGRFLRRGYLVLVDYGRIAADLYHPARRRGTLLAYHRHRATEEFLLRPGEQDLTAHVDFTAVDRAARRAGLEPAGLVSQSRFLLSLGALEFLEGEGIQERESLKDLILPERMGGVFKVLIFASGGAPRELRGLRAPWDVAGASPGVVVAPPAGA